MYEQIIVGSDMNICETVDRVILLYKIKMISVFHDAVYMYMYIVYAILMRAIISRLVSRDRWLVWPHCESFSFDPLVHMEKVCMVH